MNASVLFVIAAIICFVIAAVIAFGTVTSTVAPLGLACVGLALWAVGTLFAGRTIS